MYDQKMFIPLVEAVRDTTGIDSIHFKRVIAELEKPENQNSKKAKEILVQKRGFPKSIYQKIEQHMEDLHLRSSPFTDEKTKENSAIDRQACEAFLNYYHNEIENNDELEVRASPSP